MQVCRSIIITLSCSKINRQHFYYVHRFARLATRAFISLGIPVRLFSDLVPTPYIPFSICQFGAKAGIMVTASHNPKEDNGYKVYWDNGAQVSIDLSK